MFVQACILCLFVCNFKLKNCNNPVQCWRYNTFCNCFTTRRSIASVLYRHLCEDFDISRIFGDRFEDFDLMWIFRPLWAFWLHMNFWDRCENFDLKCILFQTIVRILTLRDFDLTWNFETVVSSCKDFDLIVFLTPLWGFWPFVNVWDHFQEFDLRWIMKILTLRQLLSPLWWFWPFMNFLRPLWGFDLSWIFETIVRMLTLGEFLRQLWAFWPYVKFWDLCENFDLSNFLRPLWGFWP